jgi:hypothetical protein
VNVNYLVDVLSAQCTYLMAFQPNNRKPRQFRHFYKIILTEKSKRMIFFLEFRALIMSRAARFFLVQHTKTGENAPNKHKIYQVAEK